MADNTKTLTVPASLDELDNVQAFIDEQLEAADCPMAAQMQVELAVEEVFVNVASYAYNPVTGVAEVRVCVETDPLRVTIQFLDHGKPFDPLAKADADLSEDATMEREGGLGIFLTKEVMDAVDYAYENGSNILTLKKNLEA